MRARRRLRPGDRRTHDASMARTHRDSSLRFAAIFEIATGLFCLLLPGTLVHLLIGAVLPAPPASWRASPDSRSSLSAPARWPARDSTTTARRPLGAMAAYSLLVAAYLACLGAGREWAGVLLWPVIVFHAAMTVVLGESSGAGDRRAVIDHGGAAPTGSMRPGHRRAGVPSFGERRELREEVTQALGLFHHAAAPVLRGQLLTRPMIAAT